MKFFSPKVEVKLQVWKYMHKVAPLDNCKVYILAKSEAKAAVIADKIDRDLQTFKDTKEVA